MATVASAPPTIEYPSSDGEPAAETPVHRQLMCELIDILQAYYAADPNVYVSGNMMMYYVEGNADKCVSPDVFVTLGIPRLPEREIYQVWCEGKGPDIVIELTSPSTARIDQRRKFDLYRDILKVKEYILFDPRDQTLAGTNLCGFRLIDDQYELIPKVADRLASEVLGLQLHASGQQLRLYDLRRAVYLPTPAEVREALRHESAARLAVEARADREAAACLAAEARADREVAARLVAEARADREIARAAPARRRGPGRTARAPDRCPPPGHAPGFLTMGARTHRRLMIWRPRLEDCGGVACA